MRKLIFCMILLGLFIPIRADAQLTYGATYYIQNRGAALSGFQNDPILRAITEIDTDLQSVPTFANGATFDNAVNNTFEWNENSDELIWTFGSNTVTVSSGDVTLFDFGTVKLGFDVFTVNAVDYTFPTADGTNTFQLTTNGSGTLSWAAAGAGASVTLDQAYDEGGAGVGRTITADTGAVVITNTDADAAFLLEVTPTPGSSAATGGVSIVSGGNATEDSFQVTNSGSGFSISTDSDVFTVASDGSIIGLDADLTGAGGLVLQNDGALTNAVDGAFKFADGGESLILTLNSNTVTLSSDDAVDQVAFGALDNLTGIDDIAFDATTTSGITKAASAGSADFTVQMSGSVDASLILSSAGTAADAMQLITTAGGIDITNGGAAGGEDLDIDAVLASLKLNADEDVADALTITASAGGIDITADGAAASDLDLVCTNGSTNLSGGEAIANAVTIVAGAGGVDITSAATFDIDITATGGKIIATANENAAGVITLTTAGGGGTTETIVILNDQGNTNASIDVDSTAGGFDLDVAEQLNLASSEASADAVVLVASAGGMDLTTAATFDIDITATGGKILATANENAAGAITLTTAGGGGTSETVVVTNDQGSGEASIGFTSTAGGLDFNAATGKNITFDGGQFIVTSNENVASAINFITNTGVSETIVVTNTQGNTAAAVTLTATAGGITLDASSGVVFTQGQTRKQFFNPKDVELDGTNPAALTDIGTDGQANVSTLTFDADGGATGDDVVYLMWHVPDGYVTDSARLNVAYSFSAAEDAADEAQFDFTVNAIAQNEAIDAAGTALSDQTTVIADGSTDNDNIHTSQYNIEVEVIAVDDYVIIEVAVDESASALTASGTLDVHYFEIEWESTE